MSPPRKRCKLLSPLARDSLLSTFRAARQRDSPLTLIPRWRHGRCCRVRGGRACFAPEGGGSSAGGGDDQWLKGNVDLVYLHAGAERAEEYVEAVKAWAGMVREKEREKER